MVEWRTPRRQFILALIVSSLVSIGLFAYGAWRNHNTHFAYLIWNLVLAWLPLALVVRLMAVLRTKLWSSWEGLGLSLLWLIFLPNSFYMISDFLHLFEIQRIDPLYDTIMFTAFIYTGVALGFTSLYLMHLRLIRRLGQRAAAGWIAVTLFSSSVAIFLGRDLRWNSWDVVTNPGGVLFDISDRAGHPADYPEMIIIILAFFILLGTMYSLMWRGIQFIRNLPKAS